jgi:hypothetical protein
MLLFVHVFVAASQCILAFSQEALVVGVLAAARLGDAKATANPQATMIERSFFMRFPTPRDLANERQP